ncbi:hypothetical protein NE865_00634 [Phthorimaea operculella]|nr:hypothetical protein NE865_00634 [Phthorimaea operculella]
MQVNRTPPPKHKKLSANDDKNKEFYSPAVDENENNDLNSSLDDENSTFVTQRPITHSKVVDMLKDIQNSQNLKFATLERSMTEIKAQNAGLQDSVKFISDMYDEMKKRLDVVESENTLYKARIQSLEDNLEQLERGSKSSSIEIRNIPLSPSEDSSKLSEHVINLGTAVNCQLQNSDIRDIFRIKLKPEKGSENPVPGPILVQLTTTTKKENLVRSVSNFNKNKPTGSKLNTSHLKLEGTKPVYVSDCLTVKARRLHYLAREFKKKHQYSSCWTAYGRVYLRKAEGSPTIRIDSEENLNNLLLI